MNRKSNLYLLVKIIFILAFLPLVLIWGVWKKTDWSKRNKWLATAGIAVVFLFLILFGDKKESVQPKETLPVKTQVQNENQRTETAAVENEKLIDDKGEEAPKPEGETFKVAHVVDGDTIKIDNGQVVRYVGIDTPETVDPRKPVQCFGKEASAENKELVEDKEVRLVKDVSETDKYGRLLRYVYVGDTFVNDYLVRKGFAKSSSYPPDVKYQDQFRQAEEEARTNKLGLWADDACRTEFCGDKICNNGETCTSCSQDCGNCPTPPPPPDSYQCNCSKTCPQMGCAEAQYQLNVCGCTRRDADHDGIACDSDCQ